MPDFDNIRAGMEAERIVTVEERQTARHLKPPVLSTPAMISLMEIVSMDVVEPLLPDGFTTVGYEVHIKHKAPAPIGAKVRVWSRIEEANGRFLLYRVRVTLGDRVIGEGLHRRTIIQKPEKT